MNNYSPIEDYQAFQKRFKSAEMFRIWARKFIINDCKKYLKDFEEQNMFEHCKEMQNVIDEKIDKMLEGFGFKDEL